MKVSLGKSWYLLPLGIRPDYLDVCIDISSKLQFQIFFGDGSVGYGPNGIDLSAFKCTQSGIDKPRDMSFGSIYYGWNVVSILIWRLMYSPSRL